MWYILCPATCLCWLLQFSLYMGVFNAYSGHTCMLGDFSFPMHLFSSNLIIRLLSYRKNGFFCGAEELRWHISINWHSSIGLFRYHVFADFVTAVLCGHSSICSELYVCVYFDYTCTQILWLLFYVDIHQFVHTCTYVCGGFTTVRIFRCLCLTEYHSGWRILCGFSTTWLGASAFTSENCVCRVTY